MLVKQLNYSSSVVNILKLSRISKLIVDFRLSSYMLPNRLLCVILVKPSKLIGKLLDLTWVLENVVTVYTYFYIDVFSLDRAPFFNRSYQLNL